MSSTSKGKASSASTAEKGKGAVSLPKVNAKASDTKSPNKPAANASPSKASSGGNSKLPAINKPTASASIHAKVNDTADKVLEKAETVKDDVTATTSVTNESPALKSSLESSEPVALANDQPQPVAEDSGNTPVVTSPVANEVSPPVMEEPPVNRNGLVTLIYEQYNEQFQIVDGVTTQEAIDDVYCLSFVMPNCLIHLSTYPPAVKRQREIDELFSDLFIPEEPRGTYQKLVADSTYYVYVEQEAEQLKRDQALQRQRAQEMQEQNKGDKIVRDDGRAGMESCSCIYGNPCVDEYGCKDWENRMAVAMKNGWKGF